jgi:acetyl-CoA carboxylase biotin carboxyl carrier protein
MADEPVDLNLVKELIRLLREGNVTEFEFRKADYRLRIRQGIPVEEITATRSVPGSNGEEQTPVLLESSGETAAQAAKESREELHEVRSPIVGTFYRSSTPGASSFVEVGDRIRKNQVLCIVEAMKIMNEIEADMDGEIRSIHATNGQPVEFGELLFSIKPL